MNYLTIIVEKANWGRNNNWSKRNSSVRQQEPSLKVNAWFWSHHINGCLLSYHLQIVKVSHVKTANEVRSSEQKKAPFQKRKWDVQYLIKNDKLQRHWETYRTFFLHLQNIVDVILFWRATRSLPLHTQPGHTCHLQLWREGWQWHTAWGEQVHHFTELAGEGRGRRRMGQNGRKRQQRQCERRTYR